MTPVPPMRRRDASTFLNATTSLVSRRLLVLWFLRGRSEPMADHQRRPGNDPKQLRKAIDSKAFRCCLPRQDLRLGPIGSLFGCVLAKFLLAQRQNEKQS